VVKDGEGEQKSMECNGDAEALPSNAATIFTLLNTEQGNAAFGSVFGIGKCERPYSAARWGMAEDSANRTHQRLQQPPNGFEDRPEHQSGLPSATIVEEIAPITPYGVAVRRTRKLH
jgi:hypothetical protein